MRRFAKCKDNKIAVCNLQSSLQTKGLEKHGHFSGTKMATIPVSGVYYLRAFMISHAFKFWILVGALFITVAVPVPADPMPKATTPDRSYTGIVTDVNTNEHCFQVKRWLLPSRQFLYGQNCAITLLYAMLNDGVGSTGSLRRGEKVTVGYQITHGVRIANRIDQQPMQFIGTVKEVNLEKGLLILHQWMSNKRLTITRNCVVALQNEKAGTLADIHPGDHIVVDYELPGDVPLAREITETNPSARPSNDPIVNRAAP